MQHEVKKFRVQEKRSEIEENLKKAVKEGIIGYKDYVYFDNLTFERNTS